MAGADEDPNTARGAYLVLIGLPATAHWRALAMIAENDMQTILASWVIGDTAPPPGVIAQAGIIGRCARIAGGMQLRGADAQKRADDTAAHQRALDLASAQSQAAAGAQAQAQGRTVPMKDVVDVARSDEPRVLDEEAVAQFFVRYRALMHRDPPWEEEPTVEQITAIHTLAQDHVPLYVDLAIFGPHGQRTLRNIKLLGLTLTAEGDLQRIELRGPPTCEAWEACMLVFRTIVIGLAAMLPQFIDDYIRKIKGYAKRYGQVAWALIYQVDVRFRREWVERIRRAEMDKHQKGSRRRRHHGLRPEQALGTRL